MMGDFGKGIKSFKHGMNEDDDKPAKQIQHEAKPVGDGPGGRTGQNPVADQVIR